ncbi:MAG: biotin synthase BioB [Lachnospiraceae bacterium]
MYEKLVEEIIAGKRLKREDDLQFLIDGDLESLCRGANQIREVLCGKHVDLCSIINGKAGRCGEDCKFCAQSGKHHTGAKEYGFLDVETILAECKRNEANGVHRFSIVTAGRSLSGEEFETAIAAYKRMHAECPDMILCASHGLLTQEQFDRLKGAGVEMYHANIETSRRNFPKICSTHTYEDKLENIRKAKKAGLTVCSGGIVGMGETWEDRLDMAVSLSELQVDSIPLNALIPVKGTPLEALTPLSEDAILRIVAMFRFVNPIAYVRLAAGRKLMENSGSKAFFSGANATITGDMLTTSGNNTTQDKAMLLENGFELNRREKVC